MDRKAFLQLLIDLDAFRVCQPLEDSKFLTELQGCGVTANQALLERLEERRWELPLVYVKYRKQKMKVIPDEDDPSRARQEPLAENEKWAGQIAEKYLYPNWRRGDMQSWINEGDMWTPEEQGTASRSDFELENGRVPGAAYYSMFQIYDLAETIRVTTFQDNAVWIPGSKADANFGDWADERMNWARRKKEHRDQHIDFSIGPSEVCQAIASRYYFKTQTDGRLFRTTHFEEEWSWYKYCQSWQPLVVLEKLGITQDDVKRFQEQVAWACKFRDPLLKWYDLLQFVSVDRKKELRGLARYFLLLHSMEHMLRLFYRDLTGDELEPVQPHPEWIMADSVEKQKHGDPSYLRFISNRYNLNPQPRLVLFLEGEGEAQELPKLARRLFGHSFDVLGIVVRNLGSVHGFVGKKRAENKYGALRRCIEELHDLQILTMVVLDNEDTRVADVKDGLSSKASSYRPQRTITRRELVFVWDKSIEFDNFTDDEIAAALTEVSGGLYDFSKAEVALARSKFGQKDEGNPLGKLYKGKLDGYGLKKPELLAKLFERLPVDEESRPIEMILDKIVWLAALNHQPTMAYTDELNQRVGMLGYPREELSDEEKELNENIERQFEPLRKLQGSMSNQQGES